MAQKRNILILFGGMSGEHEVSLLSAASVLNHIDQAQYTVHLIGITKKGQWLYCGRSDLGPLPTELSHWQDQSRPVILPPDPTYHGYIFPEAPNDVHYIDAIFPVMHGTRGEDGTLQGVLELSGIPYVGSGVLASAMAMDKVVAKQICARHHIPQCDFDWVEKHQWQADREGVLARLESKFSYPVFVKPANMGSSVGINKARTKEALIRSVEEALRYDRRVIIEEFINGREIECAVLGNTSPLAAIPGEVVSAKEFYDYDAKYDDSLGSSIHIPAQIPPEKQEEIRALALKTYEALGCRGLSRVDFFLTVPDQRVLLNEVNTLPGFTNISMYPKMWLHMGLSYSQLIDRLIALALEEEADKKALAYSVKPC